MSFSEVAHTPVAAYFGALTHRVPQDDTNGDFVSRGVSDRHLS